MTFWLMVTNLALAAVVLVCLGTVFLAALHMAGGALRGTANHPVVSRASSFRCHTEAAAQSRFTMLAEMPVCRAFSSTLKPLK
jgi:hypothetical protein